MAVTSPPDGGKENLLQQMKGFEPCPSVCLPALPAQTSHAAAGIHDKGITL